MTTPTPRHPFIALIRHALVAEGWKLTEPQVVQAFELSRLNVEAFEAEHPTCGARRVITYRPADPMGTIAVGAVCGTGDRNLSTLFEGAARLLRAGLIRADL